MIGVGLVQIPLLFAAANLDGWPMLVVALLMMMAIFGQIPLNDGIVGKYVADEYRARVLSVRYVVSLGVASIAVPMIALPAPHRGRLPQRVHAACAPRLRGGSSPGCSSPGASAWPPRARARPRPPRRARSAASKSAPAARGR